MKFDVEIGFDSWEIEFSGSLELKIENKVKKIL
jgi:hypothetical protein